MKITLSEAAIFLACSEETVMSMLRDGELPGIKPGKAWIIPEGPFYDAVNQMAVAEGHQRSWSKKKALERAQAV